MKLLILKPSTKHVSTTNVGGNVAKPQWKYTLKSYVRKKIDSKKEGVISRRPYLLTNIGNLKGSCRALLAGIDIDERARNEQLIDMHEQGLLQPEDL